jgi:2-polyprenyl-6-methoxyphenol hydroxylase-like FAD-dependent oxidoreductase
MRRAIVIGGSLGGLFAGATLLRSGWDVTIVERSGGRLEGRGAGLGVHPPMLQGLRAAGAKVDGSVGVAVDGRTAFAPDGSIVGGLRMPQFCTSWGRLYSMLSAAFPEERIRYGAALADFVEDHNGVTARFDDGSEVRADMLIGADGVRSTVRRQMFPDVDLIYAGYIGWRGMVEEAALTPSAHALIFHRFGNGASSIASTSSAVRCPAPLTTSLPDAGGTASSGTALSTPQRRSQRCRPTPRAASIPKASHPS